MKTLFNFRFFISGFLAASLMMLSCEHFITDFEIEDVPAQLVLNGILYSDSIVRIHLSKSRSVGQYRQNFEYVRDAEVVFYENDNRIGILKHNLDGIYELDYYPAPGSVCRVEVRAKNFPEVSAQTLMPQLPEIVKVDAVSRLENDQGFMRRLLDCRIFFRKTAATGNYYALSVSALVNRFGNKPNPDNWDWWEKGQEDASQSICYMESNNKQCDFYYRGDYELFEADNAPGAMMRLYFSDRLVKETTMSMPFTVDFSMYGTESVYSITVWLDAYSESLYKYLYSQAKKNYTDGDLFSENVSIYSNVKNGLGLFSAASSSAYKIKAVFLEEGRGDDKYMSGP